MVDVPLTNNSAILRQLMVRSTTKDSLVISWELAAGYTAFVNGYQVRYQAVGSAVVQESPTLPSGRSSFDITQLHENTLYGVCLTVFTNVTSQAAVACLRAATSTHSLSVALGSTFGAFLALGVVVLFVLLAKWQHFRRNRKLFRRNILTADSTESIVDDFCGAVRERDGDLEMNCIEMVCTADDPDEIVRRSRSSPSAASELSSADVILHGATVCSGFEQGHAAAQGSDGAAARGGGGGGQHRVLIGLDGYSCANSFILTSPSRDNKTGVSYSLLVPLPASGVLPFLVPQQEQQVQGHGQGHAAQGHGQGVKVKHQHPVVRLKLRKHPTVDYSTSEEECHQQHHHPQHHHPQHHRATPPPAQRPEAAASHLLELSRDRMSTTVCEPPDARIRGPGKEEGEEGRRNPDFTGNGNDRDTSCGGPNCLLNGSTGSETLPRSISNTW